MKQPQGVFTFTGNDPGKTLALMAGVHGNEVCGVRLFYEILPHFEIKRGIVHLIFGNPRAIEANVRFTEDGMNLNRAFKPAELLSETELVSYERHRAEELMPILLECEALLDIHSVRSIENTPFIICESQAFSIARRLPFSIRSSGWDTVQPGGTDYFMNTHGKIGICVECGFHRDESAVHRAKSAMSSFLAFMNATDDAILQQTRGQRDLAVFTQHVVQVGYRPARQFADFEPVRSNEIIGWDGEETLRAPEDAFIIFGGNTENRCGAEAFVLAREFSS